MLQLVTVVMGCADNFGFFFAIALNIAIVILNTLVNGNIREILKNMMSIDKDFNMLFKQSRFFNPTGVLINRLNAALFLLILFVMLASSSSFAKPIHEFVKPVDKQAAQLSDGILSCKSIRKHTLDSLLHPAKFKAYTGKATDEPATFTPTRKIVNYAYTGFSAQKYRDVIKMNFCILYDVTGISYQYSKKPHVLAIVEPSLFKKIHEIVPGAPGDENYKSRLGFSKEQLTAIKRLTMPSSTCATMHFGDGIWVILVDSFRGLNGLSSCVQHGYLKTVGVFHERERFQGLVDGAYFNQLLDLTAALIINRAAKDPLGTAIQRGRRFTAPFAAFHYDCISPPPPPTSQKTLLPRPYPNARAHCVHSESLWLRDFVTVVRRKIFVHIGDTDKIFLLSNGAKAPVRMIASERNVL